MGVLRLSALAGVLAVGMASVALGAHKTKQPPVPDPTPTAPNPPPTATQTCSVTIISGESIAGGVSATPSNGTLCINSGNYLLTRSVVITSPMSVLGVNTGGGLPVITQSGAFEMFTIGADNVEIASLQAHGYEHANSDSCDGANFVLSVGWGYHNIHDNVLDTFTCGINLQGVHDGMIQNNQISTVKYSGIALSSGSNFTISGNQLADIGADGQLNANAYGIVASGSGSGHVTISNNSVVNAPTWECYDTHGGPSIYFFNNYCYRPGRVGINAAGADAAISDSKVDSNTIDAGGLPARQEWESIVVTGSGEVVGNTIVGEGGCKIYAPNASVSGNACN
jgi:parallel beta-helix repeat protein